MKSGQSRAQANKAIRQEALREQLSAQGHLQHVIDLENKLANLEDEMSAIDVQRIKAVIESKHKLIKKYLPDLSNVTLEGEVGTYHSEKDPKDMTDEELKQIVNKSSNIKAING